MAAAPLLSSIAGGRRGAHPPHTLRRRVWDLLSTNASKFGRASGHWPTRVLEFGIALLIVVNVVIAIWGAEASYSQSSVEVGLLEGFGVLSTIVFTVEYGARLWACVESPEYAAAGRVAARLRWAAKPLALVDLVALLTFYLDFVVIGEANQVQRGLKSLRLLRCARARRRWAGGGLLAGAGSRVRAGGARSIAASCHF